MRSLSHGPIRGNVPVRDHARPYVVFRRDDPAPAEAGRERARLEGRAYIAVRVHRGGGGIPGAIVYFDSESARPALSRSACHAIWRAFADAVPLDPVDGEPLICETRTGCYAFLPYWELSAHGLARRVVDIARRDQQRTMSHPARA
jgi:hypothetical protein